MSDWSSYRKAAEHGPRQIITKVVIFVIGLSIVLGIIGFVESFIGGTANVIKEEFSPNELLRKYEWFKNASAQLDKKLADIEVYKSRLEILENSYSGLKRSDWPRDDREQFNLWSSEVAGVKASYNSLAAEYNSQMAKFNWRFTNVGDLPKGTTEPLPREFKPYEEK